MNNKDNSGKYWPYMILGFLFIGITLGFWTIKSTISLPVHESNEFMKKYQDADKGANEIEESAARFDSKYNISFSGLEKSAFKPKFLKRKPHQYYVLNELNTLKFNITAKDTKKIAKFNAVGILTRPQTEVDDKKLDILNNGNGSFEIKNFKVQKLGRYIIRLKISDDSNDTKYIDIYGFRGKN